ncbi:MAG: DMT family transporter [Neomegalonema sp.]|nr:DMT family transporter [Neomegalonema sp.]
MRFGPPMILLSPFWLKPAFASEMRDTPWLTRAAACLKPPKTDWRLVALMFGWGAPFVLVSGAGLSGASAPLMAALVPGATPLYAALIAFVFFAARPAANARLGLVLIAIAAILGLIAAPAEERASAPWFMAAALGWAGYIVAFPRSGLSSPQAVGLLSVWSVIFLVLSAPFFPTNLMHADATAIISDVLFHGVIAGVISLLAYTIALDRAPPLIAVSLPAMVPVLAATMSAAMGAPPNWGQAAGLALASIGLATIAIASVKARKSGD